MGHHEGWGRGYMGMFRVRRVSDPGPSLCPFALCPFRVISRVFKSASWDQVPWPQPPIPSWTWILTVVPLYPSLYPLIQLRLEPHLLASHPNEGPQHPYTNFSTSGFGDRTCSPNPSCRYVSGSGRKESCVEGRGLKV